MKNGFFKKLTRDEEGATIVEYGLLAAVIALSLIAVWRQIGFDLRPVFQHVADEISDEVAD